MNLKVVLDRRRNEALVIAQQPPTVELGSARDDVDRLRL
jgi:hypothetical protein